MREIEFRGKRFDNGEWVSGYYIFRDYIREFTTKDYQVDPETIGQYTGLKDKNGTKIFEGDIVNVDFIYEKNLQVVFTYGGFKLKTKDCETIFDYSITPTMIEENAIEVIGNIYDNPELLGDKE